MADITKIQPIGDTTQYTLGARYLTHTPNNTTTFLRGDNTFTNTITGPIIINGYAADNPLIIRGITGSNGTDGTPAELYLNYNGGVVYLSNGTKISANDGTMTATTFVGSLNGNATSASKLQTARTISLTGSVTGSASFDGSGNISISTSTNHSHSYLPLSGGTMTGQINIEYDKQIVFYGKNNNTSPRAQMGYMPSVTGVMHSVNNANHQTSGAFYIWSNGCDAANDNGGIAIDNEGVTVFGAGDPASNFTGVFRVVNEDNVAGGAIFRVQKDGTAYATKLYGAVWNDYAEYRITKERIEPGRCIREVGDDTLALTTERLMRGCEIVSDTFGMAIGENDLAKTPTATSGRVLAYPYESLDEFKKHIGYGVCSGPNGTVSIMTEEEERLYPMQCIGTISAVPDYDIWQSGNIKDPEEIKVNGRVWIRIR